MLLTELGFAVIAGLILTACLGAVFRKATQWQGGAWLFFAIVTLAVWAGTIWLYPFNETLTPYGRFGAAAAIGMLVGALAVWFGPVARPVPQTMQTAASPTGDPESDSTLAAGVVVTAYLWVLIVLLAGAVVVGYLSSVTRPMAAG
jgi:hypothetical protein